MALSIGPYLGDGEDLAALITRSWLASQRGRAWFPWWDGDYVAWRIMDPRVLDRDLIVCAYDGGELVGCVVGEATQLRVADEELAGSLSSYLSIAPGCTHRGLALRLIDRLRLLHLKRDLRLSLGVSNSARDADSARFWAGIAKRWPGEFMLTGRCTLWAAVADAGDVSRAGLNSLERWGPRAAALLPWGWTGRRGAALRRYRSEDFDACLRWIHAQGRHADVQMLWSRPRLSLQLDHPYARSWIAEDGDGAWGLANGYLIDWQGGERVRVGFVELCVGDGGALRLSSLLVAAARALAAEGAAMVVMMDAGAQPRGALLAAGFMPMDPKVQTMALLGETASRLARPTRLHCAFT